MDFTEIDKRIDSISDAIVAAETTAEKEALVNNLGSAYEEVMFNADYSEIMDCIKRSIGEAFLRAAYSKE